MLKKASNYHKGKVCIKTTARRSWGNCTFFSRTICSILYVKVFLSIFLFKKKFEKHIVECEVLDFIFFRPQKAMYGIWKTENIIHYII